MTPRAGRDYGSYPFGSRGAEELTRCDSSTHNFSVTTRMTTWKVHIYIQYIDIYTIQISQNKKQTLKLNTSV